MDLFNRVLGDVVDLTEVARLNGFDAIVQDLENIGARLRVISKTPLKKLTVSKCSLCNVAPRCRCEWSAL